MAKKRSKKEEILEITTAYNAIGEWIEIVRGNITPAQASAILILHGSMIAFMTHDEEDAREIIQNSVKTALEEIRGMANGKG